MLRADTTGMGRSGRRAGSYQVTVSAGRAGVPGTADGSFRGQQVAAAAHRVRPSPGRMASAGSAQVGVDLAGHVTLQAAEDLLLSQALFAAPGDVGPGGRVRAHPAGHDPPQGLAGRSPPRLSRQRVTFPEEAGIGAVPPRCARAASLRSRPGWSPAAISSSAAVSGPAPCRASRPGIRAVTSGPMSPSRCPIWVSGNRARRPGSRHATRGSAGGCPNGTRPTGRYQDNPDGVRPTGGQTGSQHPTLRPYPRKPQEAGPEALSTSSLPNIRFSTIQHVQRNASADPPILRVIAARSALSAAEGRAVVHF